MEGTWGGVILKLKTAFCEYWTSIKIKFRMMCAYRVWNQPGGKLIFGGRGEQKFGGEWSESTGGGGGDFSRWG